MLTYRWSLASVLALSTRKPLTQSTLSRVDTSVLATPSKARVISGASSSSSTADRHTARHTTPRSRRDAESRELGGRVAQATARRSSSEQIGPTDSTRCRSTAGSRSAATPTLNSSVRLQRRTSGVSTVSGSRRVSMGSAFAAPSGVTRRLLDRVPMRDVAALSLDTLRGSTSGIPVPATATSATRRLPQSTGLVKTPSTSNIAAREGVKKELPSSNATEATESVGRPTLNSRRSPSRLPTLQQPPRTNVPGPTIDDSRNAQRVFALGVSDSSSLAERRESWETMPGSARPSLSTSNHRVEADGLAAQRRTTSHSGVEKMLNASRSSSLLAFSAASQGGNTPRARPRDSTSLEDMVRVMDMRASMRSAQGGGMRSLLAAVPDDTNAEGDDPRWLELSLEMGSERGVQEGVDGQLSLSQSTSSAQHVEPTGLRILKSETSTQDHSAVIQQLQRDYDNAQARWQLERERLEMEARLAQEEAVASSRRQREERSRWEAQAAAMTAAASAHQALRQDEIEARLDRAAIAVSVGTSSMVTMCEHCDNPLLSDRGTPQGGVSSAKASFSPTDGRRLCALVADLLLQQSSSKGAWRRPLHLAQDELKQVENELEMLKTIKMSLTWLG